MKLADIQEMCLPSEMEIMAAFLVASNTLKLLLKVKF